MSWGCKFQILRSGKSTERDDIPRREQHLQYSSVVMWWTLVMGTQVNMYILF